MVRIGASLLAANFACLGEEAERAERAGVDSLHLDVMDGHYVHNLALTPHHLRALRSYTELPFTVHLEIERPWWILDMFSFRPTDTVIVQVDTCPRPAEVFDLIRVHGARVGIGVNPCQPVETVRHLLPEIDLLLILGVEPGFGGQTLQPHAASKIAASRDLIERHSFDVLVAVDGGIGIDNVGSLVEAGADLLIIGTSLFSAPNMLETVDAVRCASLMAVEGER